MQLLGRVHCAHYKISSSSPVPVRIWKKYVCQSKYADLPLVRRISISMSKSKLTFSIKPDSGKNSWFLTFCNWSVDNTSNYISNDLLKNCLTDEEFRSCKFQVPQSTTIFEFFNEISVVWILISTVLHTPDTLPHLFVYFRNVKLVSWFFVYLFGKIILSL